MLSQRDIEQFVRTTKASVDALLGYKSEVVAKVKATAGYLTDLFIKHIKFTRVSAPPDNITIGTVFWPTSDFDPVNNTGNVPVAYTGVNYVPWGGYEVLGKDAIPTSTSLSNMSLAYNSNTDTYVAVVVDDGNTSGLSFVDASIKQYSGLGLLLNNKLLTTTTTSSVVDIDIAIAASAQVSIGHTSPSTVTGIYFVVYNKLDSSTGKYQLVGRILDIYLRDVYINEIIIEAPTDTSKIMSPRVVFNSTSSHFMICWLTYNSSNELEAYAATYNTSGEVVTAKTAISTAVASFNTDYTLIRAVHNTSSNRYCYLFSVFNSGTGASDLYTVSRSSTLTSVASNTTVKTSIDAVSITDRNFYLSYDSTNNQYQVVYTYTSGGSSILEAKTLAADGTTLSNTEQLRSLTTGSVNNPTNTRVSGTEFAVSWMEYGVTGINNDIRAVKTNASNAVSSVIYNGNTGARYTVADYPYIFYNSNSQKYNVFYLSGFGDEEEIKFLSTNFASSSSGISSGGIGGDSGLDFYGTHAIFNSTYDRFLVSHRDSYPTDTALVGRLNLYSSNRDLIQSKTVVSTERSVNGNNIPIAFDTTNYYYAVAFCSLNTGVASFGAGYNKVKAIILDNVLDEYVAEFSIESNTASRYIGQPSMNFNSTNTNFMVVWPDFDTGTGKVSLRAAVIDYTGAFVVTPTEILTGVSSSSGDSSMRVYSAYNSTSNRFAYLFVINNGGTFELRTISRSNTLTSVATNTLVRSGIYGTLATATATIAYNATDNDYQVAYVRESGGTYYVSAKILEADGTTLSGEVNIYSGSNVISNLSNAWDSDKNQYLLTWTEVSGSDYSIKGILSTSASAAIGSAFTFNSSTMRKEDYAKPVYNPVMNQFFVAYLEGDTDGTILEEVKTLTFPYFDEISSQFDYDPTTTTGLTFGRKAGKLRNGSTIYSIAAGTTALTNGATNYIEINSAGTISANTTSFSANSIPLWEVVTSGSVITQVTDKRSVLQWYDPSVVTSFNTLTGDVTISAGTGITLTPSGQNIAISASSTNAKQVISTFFPGTTALASGGWYSRILGTISDSAVTKYFSANSGGSSFTDDTTDANDSDANDFSLSPTATATNNAVYWGHTSKFFAIKLTVGTNGAGGYDITWEYSKGSGTWGTLTFGLQENAAFKSGTGTFYNIFDPPSDWATDTVNGQASTYWVRARNNNGGSITTQPLGTQTWVWAINAGTGVPMPSAGSLTKVTFNAKTVSGSTTDTKFLFINKTAGTYTLGTFTKANSTLQSNVTDLSFSANDELIIYSVTYDATPYQDVNIHMQFEPS